MNICKKLLNINPRMADKPLYWSCPQTILNSSMSSNAARFQIDDEKKAFHDALPSIIDSVLRHPNFVQEPEFGHWLKKVLQHNLIGGKNTRGITTVITYKIMEEPENISEETMKLARTLGWCIEMSGKNKEPILEQFQAYSVILDDIMDGSTTRRGRPCWYRRPDVGLACAIKDSILVHSVLFLVLKNHFNTAPNYKKMFQLFNETMLLTSMGQHLDYKTAKTEKQDYRMFTADRYNAIVEHKASYYTFNLPVTLGLLLVENVDQHIFKHAQNICLRIGKLFQIQDDFLDCFGDESVTGKAGTDIREGKCSWLAVQALQRCSTAQRFVFSACYGSQEPAHLERIKRLYEELQLREIYTQEQRELYEDILERTHAVPSATARMLFHTILEITYNRKH